ncbi:MAG: DUF3445 domain-containing protein [Bryobacter sp.]|jgi:hypothetical protein|nr:DUF3445 domain-containing protein [Bryobacter sp. CoA8 C33]
MIPPLYFPLSSPQYDLRIGASPLPAGQLIFEPDEHFTHELALKRHCLDFNPHYYCQSLPGSEAAQAELARLLGLSEGGIRAAGDSVQEDLLLLDLSQPGLPLIAGHLCFANAWCLDDKIGRPFLSIHAPVPDFENTIGPSSQKLIERLKPGRPISRLNWAVKSTGQLDLTSRWDAFVASCNAAITPQNAGTHCWMRAERQTLCLLPQSNTALFTVHTYTQPVSTLTPAQQLILRGVLLTCPDDMLRYKGIWPFLKPLLAWLTLIHNSAPVAFPSPPSIGT